MATSLYSDKKFLIYLQVWWFLCILLQYLIYDQLGIDRYHAIIDAVLSNLILAWLCFLLANIMKYYLPRNEKYWYILVSSLVVCFLWLLLLQIGLYLIFPANDAYLQFVQNSWSIRFGAGFLLVSSLSMFSMLYYNQQEQKDAQARKDETEKLSREAELFKLRQQLQPHFLFNSLNSISALTISDPEKARHMIQQLSEFLRGMLKKDEQSVIPLEEEIHYLQLYLDIEKVRFGHRLQTTINVDEDAKAYVIPPLLLQPLVENAIKFGLYDTIDDVVITINAHKTDHHLLIRITNPFDPETSMPAKGTGFGLTSIARRLYLIYSRADLLKTGKEERVFTTEILIPQST